MDMQFELGSHLVSIEWLEANLGTPTIVQTLRHVVGRLELQGDIICQEHDIPPSIIVSVGAVGIEVRVGGCCQLFTAAIRANILGMVAAEHPYKENILDQNLVIRLLDRDKDYEFEVVRIDRLVIGRLDPDTGDRPEIDLSVYGAYDNGVSRRHASVVRWYQCLFLTDEGSQNGTYLNNRLLLPYLPFVLKNDDHVRIGRLVLEVKIDQPHRVPY